MSQDSWRVTPLPSNWQELRRAVAERAGGRCEVIKPNGKRCWDRGTDCDHIRGGADGGQDHSLENLQWICTWHHRRKTSAEANAARAARRPSALHPGEPHPSGM